MARIPDRHEYQVAIICALGAESDAIEGIFDELYETRNALWQKADGDRNTYTVGRVGKHNVVLAHMPGIGKVNAATTASSIRATFPSISNGLALVAGVCGGSPQTQDGENLYLGDIVISTSIQQADFGREHVDGFETKDHNEGNLGAAPVGIQTLLRKLQTRVSHSKLMQQTADYAVELMVKTDIELPDPQSDKLFPTDYIHKHQDHTKIVCQVCIRDPLAACQIAHKAMCTQLGCNSKELRLRPEDRPVTKPKVMFGAVCSTDAVKRNGASRNELIERHKVLAFEMEGAGVWNTLPSLVVKAICDYADSHKNKKWQEYAAINAAACCKALIEEWMANETLFDETSRPSNGLESHEDVSDQYLASLDFEQIDSRLHNINFAYSGTCNWIFQTYEFESWLDEADSTYHHGVLWIKGKPGAGKSVLMKHIYQSKQYFEGFKTAAYFFHARGTNLQHTIIGLYRSLLYQLMSENHDLLQKFIAAFPPSKRKRARTQNLPGSQSATIEISSWTVEELQHFLLLAAQQGWLTDTVLFIDALDECNHDDARELVSFCEDLAMNAQDKRARLLICLSIRHFPNININKCVQLDIDVRSEHDADIESYTRSKLRVKQFVPIILEKAQHIFLWAVLVVQILNRSHDNGASYDAMKQQLITTPTGLHEIFHSLLHDDQDGIEDTVFILQIVLYQEDFFSPLGLYQLMIVHRGLEIELFDEESITKEAAWNFVVTAAKGLLECNSDNGQLKVQFIHESVRDFLLKIESAKDLQHINVLTCASLGHETIARVCIGLAERWRKSVTRSNVEGLYKKSHILYHISGIETEEALRSLLRSFARAYKQNNSIEQSIIDTILFSRLEHLNNGEEIVNQHFTRLLEIALDIFDDLYELIPDLQEYQRRDWTRNKSYAMKKVMQSSLRLVYQNVWTDGSHKLVVYKNVWIDGLRQLLTFNHEPVLFDNPSQPTMCINLFPHHAFQQSDLSEAIDLVKEHNRSYWTAMISRIRSQNQSHTTEEIVILALPTIISPCLPTTWYTHVLADIEDQLEKPGPEVALYIAIYFAEPEACEALLMQGVSHGNWQRTAGNPLAFAVLVGNPDTVAVLLRYGADPNAGCSATNFPTILHYSFSDYDGDRAETILNMALYKGHLDIVALLLQYGANPYTVSASSNLNAFQAAQWTCAYPFYTQLMPEIRPATSKESLKLLTKFVEANDDENRIDTEHRVPPKYPKDALKEFKNAYTAEPTSYSSSVPSPMSTLPPSPTSTPSPSHVSMSAFASRTSLLLSQAEMNRDTLSELPCEYTLSLAKKAAEKTVSEI